MSDKCDYIRYVAMLIKREMDSEAQRLLDVLGQTKKDVDRAEHAVFEEYSDDVSDFIFKRAEDGQRHRISVPLERNGIIRAGGGRVDVASSRVVALMDVLNDVMRVYDECAAGNERALKSVDRDWEYAMKYTVGMASEYRRQRSVQGE